MVIYELFAKVEDFDWGNNHEIGVIWLGLEQLISLRMLEGNGWTGHSDALVTLSLRKQILKIHLAEEHVVCRPMKFRTRIRKAWKSCISLLNIPQMIPSLRRHSGQNGPGGAILTSRYVKKVAKNWDRTTVPRISTIPRAPENLWVLTDPVLRVLSKPFLYISITI
jgi:hypothetical protein